MLHEASDESPFVLATLPPSQRQLRAAIGIVVVLFIAFIVTAPLANTQLPRVDAFIPVNETVILINDLIISALLFSQYSILRRRALLMLASGYLFTALLIIPHALTFPGVFAPTGLLGAGLETTVWLYIFGHLASPIAVIVYALVKEADTKASVGQRSPVLVISLSIAIVTGAVCGLTWAVIAADSILPQVFRDSIQMNQSIRLLVGCLIIALDVVALALLWRRRRSVLDLWLKVNCCVWLFEAVMTAILINARYSLGFYAGRAFGIVATFIVLLVLLSETTAVYAQLAQSVARQRRDRQARQIAMDAMAASIAHEINQPLAAMVTNANAAVRWLTRATPDLDRTLTSLNYIVDDGHRVKEVIAGIRSMFQKGAHGRVLLSANDLIREVLKMVDRDLRAQQVSVETELHNDLPQLLADRGQLQQVFLNLITNAIEAMGPITDRARVFRVRSDIYQESSQIVVAVEDTGTGIEIKDRDQIFEPFFTTKSTGTGIGLSICRMIIESHGGSLRASANKPYGTIFHVILPSSNL